MAEKVHLIDEEGKSQGVISRDQALILAHQRDYDLVQVSQVFPPVCRLIDFGKYKYELEKKERKSKQKRLELKEMRMKLAIEPHDLEIKRNKVKQFLEKGHKVKVTVILKGREMAHLNRGFEFIKNFKDNLGEDVFEDKRPGRMGNRIFNILTKKK